MSLPRFALRNPVVVTTASALALVWGTLALFTMPRRENPSLTTRVCVVATTWPGAPAAKIELLVTDPVEKAISGLAEVKRVSSLTTLGHSAVFVDLEGRLDKQQADNAWDRVRAKIDEMHATLPDGCREPLVDTDFGDQAAMLVALYQTPPPGSRRIQRPYTPRELEVVAKRLRDAIKPLAPVADAKLFGVHDEVIYLEVDTGTWSQLDLTTDQLRNLLAVRNIVAPGGTLETDLGRFSVKPTGEFRAVRQLERVVVGAAEPSGTAGKKHGAPVYLSDLGVSVSRRYVEPPDIITRFLTPQTTAPCLILSVTMKDGENIAELGRAVRSTLAMARTRLLPRDIAVTVVSDQPRTVDRKVNEFLSNLGQAVVVVVLVVFLLAGLRLAAVMATAIPLVILCSLGLVRLFHVELEQVSIASLIIALGMLVDNAVEVGENTLRHLGEGVPRPEAAARGAEQVARPILVATLTTVAAFGPMLLLPGEEGEYLRSLPIVVATTLLTSWVVALTVTTLAAHWLLRPTRHGTALSPLVRLGGMVKSALSRTRRPAGRGLAGHLAAVTGVCLRHKFVTLGVAAALFVGACALVAGGLIETQYFPPAYRDQFVIDIFLPEGAPIHRTDAVCKKVEAIVRELSPREGDEATRAERLVSMVSFVGQGGPRFYLNIDPEQPASNYAQVLVNARSASVVESYVQDIRRETASRIPGARVVPRILDMGPPVDSPIGVRVSGDDPNMLRHYASRLRAALRPIEGMVDVHDTWGTPGYQLHVEIDEDQASLSGVTNAAVAQSLNAFFTGHYLTTYHEGDHSIPIVLRLRDPDGEPLAALKAVAVEGRQGKVLLDAVARIETRWETARIWRRGQKRSIEVRARVCEGLLPNTVLARALPAIRQVEASLLPGYHVEIAGEQEGTTESQENISKCFGVSVLLIILCLVAYYNSFAKAGVILVTLPLAATGAFVGLYVTGRPLGFMAQLGLLSLAGIAVNDAVVLTDFVQTLIEEKLRSKDGVAGPAQRAFAGLTRNAFRNCVTRATRMRVLPIFLTSLTTIGGLLPLALYGGPLWEPMAIVIMFGLACNTLLTLLVVPCIYALLVESFGMRVVPKAAESAAPPEPAPEPPRQAAEPPCADPAAEPSPAAGPLPPPQQAGCTCPECGQSLVVCASLHGSFIGCSAYPMCRYTEPHHVQCEVAQGAEPQHMPSTPLDEALDRPFSPTHLDLT